MKNYKDLRIVFMGTPEFAVASLDKLVTDGCNIVAVITAPDKQAGRGLLLQQSAVKKYAVEKGLHILQPEKLKNADFLEELSDREEDFIDRAVSPKLSSRLGCQCLLLEKGGEVQVTIPDQTQFLGE